MTAIRQANTCVTKYDRELSLTLIPPKATILLFLCFLVVTVRRSFYARAVSTKSIKDCRNCGGILMGG